MLTSKNWEDYATPEAIHLVKAIEADENPHPEELEMVKFLKASALGQINCPYTDVLATPLLEFSSVTISNDRLIPYFGEVFQDHIHSIVKVIDSDSREFVLFDSDTCDVANVFFFDHPNLVIRLENSELNRPQFVPEFVSLKLLIEDRSQGTEMLDSWPLIFETNVVYDKQNCLEVHSHVFGRVFVCYTYFRYATLASVECRLQTNDNGLSVSEDIFANVCGSISVGFKVRDQIITRKLLNGPAILLPPKLCWSSWLAVPAYSPLEILVHDLRINQEKIDTSGHNLNFEPNHNYSKTVEIMSQKWCLLVTVAWRHIYMLVPGFVECNDVEGSVGGDSTYSSEFEESDSGTSEQSSEVIEATSQWREEKRPRLQLQSIQLPQLDVNMIMPRSEPLPALSINPLNLIEVFSISVCPFANNLDNSFLLYGTIKCRDFFGEHELFDREKTSPYLLCSHQTISIGEPRRCYTSLNFCMDLKLKDIEDREISYGSLCWCFVTAPSWLERRMCSIVRGKDGFAAVHYTMFADATQARVAISFVSKDNCQYQVYGKIRARYTGYRYSTQYDRKYYQSVLFHRSRNEYVILHHGKDVPLSKLVVAVPLDESLIIRAKVKLLGGGREEVLKGKVEFKAQRVGEPLIMRIEEPNKYGLLVSVSWG